MPTPSQTEAIEKIKTSFRYKYGLKGFKFESFEGFDFISISGDGDGYHNHFQAIIGSHGAISLYREGNVEWKGKKAESHIYYILKEMAEKGLYQFPKRASKPDPTVYGIQFYSSGDRKSHRGFYSIGIHRNAQTEKYFKWSFPNDDMWGVLFEYSYISNGGDGLMLIDLPSGERERVSFSYEPHQYLYVRGTDFEERIPGNLSNRQIIAKVFKAWLKSRNLI